jgi:carbamate kinase
LGSHKKVVIALGGNALLEKDTPPTAEAQLEVIKRTCGIIADIKNIFNYELGITHGNGPQVGRILLASEAAAAVTPVMPLEVCAAMSQGYIGYQIQQALKSALAQRGRILPVVTLVTQVLVDKDDPAFQNPSKPIGPYYSKEEADRLADEKGYVMKEDSDRGWRRVVASPKPIRIMESRSINELWDSTIVVAAGGGGIAVIEKDDGSLEGVHAVIDKDLAAEKMAEDVGADYFLMLTEVEHVYLNYHHEGQSALGRITADECEKNIAEGHFAAGSMLPKMQAAVQFARAKPGGTAIITSLFKAVEALRGETGTHITLS